MEPLAGLSQLFKAMYLCSWPGLQLAFALLLDLIAPWQLEVGQVGKTFFPSWPALLCPSPSHPVLPPFWGPQGGADEVGVSRAQLASVLRNRVDDEPQLSQEAWSPDQIGE